MASLPESFAFNEESHTYTLGDLIVPSVTDISSMLTSFGNINPEIIRQAARRGTRVHELCQLIDYGVEPDVLEVETELAGYVLAYMHFLRDFKPSWEHIEEMYYSDFLKLAGTLDRYGTVDGEPWLLDIKTASSPDRATKIAWSVQLDLYAQISDLRPKKMVDLLLKNDGTYRLIDSDETQFKYHYNVFELSATLLSINFITKGDRHVRKQSGSG